MSATDTYMPVSPPPPVDITTYSRSMHQHTKRQMEAASRSSHRHSGGRSSQRGGVPAMPNGVSSSSTSSTSPDRIHDYHDWENHEMGSELKHVHAIHRREIKSFKKVNWWRIQRQAVFYTYDQRGKWLTFPNLPSLGEPRSPCSRHGRWLPRTTWCGSLKATITMVVAT